MITKLMSPQSKRGMFYRVRHNDNCDEVGYSHPRRYEIASCLVINKKEKPNECF